MGKNSDEKKDWQIVLENAIIGAKTRKTAENPKNTQGHHQMADDPN